MPLCRGPTARRFSPKDRTCRDDVGARTGGWAQAGHTVRAFAWSVGAALEIDHDPPLDFTMMHARENIVDVLQRVRRDGRANLALRGKIKRFLQIEPRADDGATNSDPVQDRVEKSTAESRLAEARSTPPCLPA